MKRKKTTKLAPRNTFVSAMMRRHPRKQVHSKGQRRARDARNHWSRDQ